MCMCVNVFICLGSWGWITYCEGHEAFNEMCNLLIHKSLHRLKHKCLEFRQNENRSFGASGEVFLH